MAANDFSQLTDRELNEQILSGILKVCDLLQQNISESKKPKKDTYSVTDIMQIKGVSRSSASKIMNAIRRWGRANGTLRLDMEGKIDVQDYNEYFRLISKTSEE